MPGAVGFSEEDFERPQIGIASTWSMVTPCNMHIGDLASEAAKAADSAGGKGVIFNTISVSDGISMGTPGMRYSLVSREIIADSIEAVTAAEGFDGLVAIGGCDKNMPACVMAMARLNRPSNPSAAVIPFRSSQVSAAHGFSFRLYRIRSLKVTRPLRSSWSVAVRKLAAMSFNVSSS